jgi:hypothetical protein
MVFSLFLGITHLVTTLHAQPWLSILSHRCEPLLTGWMGGYNNETAETRNSGDEKQLE